MQKLKLIYQVSRQGDVSMTIAPKVTRSFWVGNTAQKVKRSSLEDLFQCFLIIANNKSIWLWSIVAFYFLKDLIFRS